MRLKLLLIAIALFVGFGTSYGQIAQFNFPATSSLVVTTKDANTTVSNIVLSTGTIETNITTGTYFPNEPYIEETDGWTATSQATAKNFNFTITAASGYQFTITNISFNAYATSAGPSAFGFAIGASNIYSVNAPSASLVNVNQAVSGQTNLSSATINIQGWLNGSRTSSGAGIFKLDDVIITGTVTASGITSTQNGPWSSSSTWVGGIVPTSSQNVIIAHNVTTGAVTRDSGTTTTINTGASLAVSGTYTNDGTTTVNGSFQLNSDGWATGNNFTYGATGTLNFNSSGSYGVSNTDVFWPISNGPFNVNVLQGGVTLNSANRTIAGTFATAAGVTLTSSILTLNGTAQINGGGFFNQSPIYGNASTLKYNTGGTFGRGLEWFYNGVGTVGIDLGYPNNVQLSNSTTLNYNNGTPLNKAISGNLIIDSGSSFYMDYGGGASGGVLTIAGSVTNNGNFTLGNAVGDDLVLKGNWTNSGTFTPNSRLVTFNGVLAQTLTGATTFDYLTLNNSTGLTLANPITVNLTLALTSGKITIGANNLTIGSSGTITGYSSSNYVVTASTGKLVKLGVGNVATIFPIGFSITNYTPVTLTNTSGTSDLSVSVKQSVTNTVTDATKIVTLEWGVTSSAVTTATISPTWVAATPINQATSFTNTGTGEIGNYTTAYTTYPVTLNTTTTTATGIPLQSGTNLIVIGDTGAVYTPAPVNDLCGNATTLVLDATPISGTLLAATATSGNTFSYASTKRDVWYTFTPTCSGSHTITVNFSTGPDIDFDVFTTSCPTSGTAPVNAHGSVATSETLTASFISGTIYKIRVIDFNTNSNAFTIGITSPTPATQTVISSAASLVASTTATLNGNVTTLGVCPSTTEKGFVYSITTNNADPFVGGSGVTKNIVGSPATGAYLLGLTGLSGTTNYTFKAYVFNGTTYTYGATFTFTTTIPPCLSEGFDSGTTVPSGWAFTSIGGTYTTSTNYGTSSPSLQFDATNDQVGTSAITGLATELTFWIKGQGTDASSSLLVEGYNGSSWETVENIIPLPTTATTKIYNTTTSPALDQSFIKFRFTYSKNNGNLALDDITVNCIASCNPPTTQASVFTSSALTPSSATIGWTRGNGNNVLVIVKAVSAVDTDPVSGNSYTANLTFGQGSQLGTGNYVLVSGAVNTANITGLASGTTYHFAVYEWNTAESCYNVTQLTGNFTTPTCTPNTISTIFPSSGPVGTEVTITATSGTFLGATATFNGISATVLSSSATTLVVKIPTGATTGNLVITNASNCPTSNAYTIINNMNNDCQGGTTPSDIFISEVTDETYGSLTYVELYNGTASSINLTTGNYSIAVYNNGSSSSTCTIPLVGSVAPNGIFILALGSSTNAGGVVPNQTSLFCSINNNDNVRLLKNGAGLDQFGYQTKTNLTGVGAVGYTFRRKNTVVAPKYPVFLESDWNVIDAPDAAAFGSGTNYTNVGFYTPIPGAPPTVSLPTNDSTCKTTSLTIIGAEGYNGTSPADAKELNYQWYVSAPNAIGWTKIITTTDGSVYTNFTSATLNISNNSGLTNYQYYCQISEDSNTCYIASNAIKIIDGTITWNGTDWRDVNNVITATSLDKLAVINMDYNTSAKGSFSACSVVVNSGKTLTITANEYVKIQNDLTNNGTVNILTDGSLVQVDDNGVNTGNITYERIVPVIHSTDYTYWSSPVLSQNLQIFSPDTPSNKFYSFNAAVVPEDWKNEIPSSVSMDKGVGYCIYGPQLATPPAFFVASFIGKPNNGKIDVPIIWNNDPLGTSNLIGNPYPSAIDADKFLFINQDIIEGTIYFWTHNTDLQLRADIIASGATPGTGALAYTSDDYASYNSTGGTAGSGVSAISDPNHPIVGPDLGKIPNGKIAAGQAFFTTSKLVSGNAIFNNSMRIDNLGKVMDNSQFFKTKIPKTKTTKTIEKHRIWLDLTNTQGVFKQTLVGYITDATNEYDTRFDGESFDGNEFVDFYSINQEKNLVIQGRALPFDENDQVPLGFRTTIEGAFTIKIDQADGVLTNQAVFIEDKLTNTIFDLRSGPYTFNTVAGTFNDRFVLRYTNKTLGTIDLETLENQVLVSNKNKQIKINSKAITIDKVMVYDLLGRLLFKKDKVNSNEFSVLHLISNSETLLVKVTLQNGEIVTRKILY